jgi:hypothetical protein
MKWTKVKTLLELDLDKVKDGRQEQFIVISKLLNIQCSRNEKQHTKVVRLFL